MPIYACQFCSGMSQGPLRMAVGIRERVPQALSCYGPGGPVQPCSPTGLRARHDQLGVPLTLAVPLQDGVAASMGELKALP